jgi:CRP/FNR family transcriptional regulator, cyclic AMP receptor protein
VIIDLGVFADEADVLRFEKGARIFTEGEDGKHMYVILEGDVDLRVGMARVETLGQGEPFGEMALIDLSPRMASAIAATDCTIAAINEERFLKLVSEHPTFALQMMGVMAGRLRLMGRKKLGFR